jgi:hypothetical protein
MRIYAPDGSAVTYPYSVAQLRKDNPQVSFPKNPTDELLASYDVFPVIRTDRPEYDSITQNLTEGAPALVEGVWTQMWTISDATPEEIERRTADLASSVRRERDDLLAASDWIVIKSYERNQNIPSEWEVYRQALRDIPSQEGFPREVIWPAKPE